MSLEIKKKRLDFCRLKNFETKMNNLLSDFFILLSVHPMWRKGGGRMGYDGGASRKIRI